MRTETTDVLIVGAGPAGLTLTALLARAGVKAITVSRWPGTAHTPRAHITNQRAMEVFRDLGAEPEVMAAAQPSELMGHNVWATSMTGRELARMYAWGRGPERRADYENASPSTMTNIGQHDLEPILRRTAEGFDADLRFSNEMIAIRQDADGVEAEIRNENDDIYLIRARYAVGCDGGRSLVASTFGFDMQGEMGLGSAVNVWLEADLEKYRKDRPGSLFFTIQPGRDFWLGAGTFVTVRPWNEFVLIIVYDPKTETLDLDEAALIARARKIIGDPEIPIRIKNVSEWQLNHVVAAQYRKGRVFIAGDAAHRHPPANGLGSNTSVQDAFNLGWKLALVCQGLAGDGLLDTYNDERQPVGRQVIDRAMKSVGAFGKIPGVFGVAAGQTDEEGQAALDGFFADDETGRSRRAELRAVLDENEYHFNAHGVELGQRYTSGAVRADGATAPAYDRDPELYYHPTTFPGAVLPHVWVVREGERISTLDLVGKGEFTLLTGTGGQAWTDAAKALSAEMGLPIRVSRIGRGQPVDDAYGDWARRGEIGEDGALLVRPDRHVAWRSTGTSADPVAALRDAMTSILAR